MPACLLRMRAISKSYPGVKALTHVDLDLRQGEVLALVGENGAGKSTLIKVLGGAHRPDSGEILIEDADPHIHCPRDAIRAGIAVIYQEFNLVPSLSASDNLFLGQESTTAGFVHPQQERHRANELFKKIGVDVDTTAPVRSLSIAQQQVVEIAKALSLDAKILVMDEPSATLTPQEVERLLDVVRELKSHGIGIIYITHRLDEVFAVADRVMVLRDGQHVGSHDVKDVNRTQLIEKMVGRKLENEFPKRDVTLGETRLVIEGLQRGDVVRDVSFSVSGGEILGVTGLVGAGRTEMARLIFGADEREKGTIIVDNVRRDIRHPRDAIRHGIGLLTEDRKSQGLVLNRSVQENFGLPNLSQFSRSGFLQPTSERKSLINYVKTLRTKISHPEQSAGNLSGGNQQKVVLSKWLQRDCNVIIFDEPTRGIDVGGKYEIYQLMNDLAAAGKSIIMISSELPEILGMSDRILVMHAGRVAGEIHDVTRATQAEIMHLAVGEPMSSS